MDGKSGPLKMWQIWALYDIAADFTQTRRTRLRLKHGRSSGRSARKQKGPAGVTAPARPRGDESSMHSSPEV